VSKSKREKKISKVMGEFKEGTLKSGGSGRQVTNPKQAIAIALSEANAMNQGGMMYNEIMNRPMFQTPQMREGGGIMAGIAPIRGYAEGDLVSDDFFTLEKTEEGSGMNLRDVTDFFFDPEDPIDYATIGLMAFPPAAIAARLLKMGVSANKAAEQVQKVVKAQEAIPGKLGGGSSRAATGLQVQVGAGVPMAMMGEEAMAQEMPTPVPDVSPEGIETLMKQEDTPEIVGGRSRAARNMSAGGIASVPGYAAGKFVSAIFNRIFKKAEKGEDVTKDIQKALDDEKLTPEEAGDIMEVSLSPGSSYNVAAVGAKAADAASDVAEVVPQTIGGRMAAAARRGVGPRTAAALGATGAGTGFIAGMPTPPEAPELTDYAKSRLSDVEKARAEGFPTDLSIEVDEDTGGDESTDKKTPQTFREMFNAANERLRDFYSDPATQYALAKAAQPTEGFVPRNALSDFVLAKEEYKQLEARRKSLEDDDETALMKNLKLLKAEKPEASVDELLNLLLSKDTESDLIERYQDAVLSLFTKKSSEPENTGRSEQELLSEARQEAANIYGIPLAGMSDASEGTVKMSEEELKQRQG
tara:strand:+ start:1614 stop:3365 length:1752 start_codon:yes stop_codon:yes gene_type:complete